MNCKKCDLERINELISDYRKSGLTFRWQPTDITRERWWFGNKVRIQQKEVKIAMPPESLPHPIVRWKTIRKEER